MRLAAVVTFAFLGACSVTQPDPCAAVDAKTSCIAVTVTGSGSVDTLDVVASGAFDGETTSAFKKPSSLPVVFAVTPVPNSTGDVKLTITGTLKGAFVGEGSNTLIGVTGDPYRKTLEVHLTATPGDDLAVSSDMASPNDSAIPPGDVCTPNAPVSCTSDSTMLNVCTADGQQTKPTSCAYGCLDTGIGVPHCAVFTPHPPVTVDMLNGTPDGGVVEVTGPVTIDTDSGAISDGVRDQNDVATEYEVKSGIGFQLLASGASFFSVDSIDFNLGSTAIVVGGRPLVIVAREAIFVSGTIDARPYDGAASPPGLCAQNVPGPGGFAGGASGPPGNGIGGGAGGGSPGTFSGQGTSSSGGGGGAGYSSVGGIGGSGNHGTDMPAAGGAAGPVVNLVSPIVGGSGGGSGTGAALGGPGGGAVQLVAGTQITIGDGSAVSAVGINVSGCGGQSGAMSGSPSGGGAGGTVLVESPGLTFATYGAIVANGGSGAGGDDPSPIASPLANAQPPAGARDTSGGEANTGGAGGWGTELGGGTSNGSAAIMDETLGGGAGGGSAGRIALYTKSGGVVIDSPAFVSPATSTVAVLMAKIILQ